MLAVAMAGALSVTALAQSGPRRDGTWEVTMEMSMPGMPAGMAMPPMKVTQCITPQEAQDPEKLVPRQPQQPNNGDCKVSDYKVEGNKVSWKMACTGRQKMTGTGEVVYTADTYTGMMQMNMEGGNMPGQMTMKYSDARTACPGRDRLGGCTLVFQESLHHPDHGGSLLVGQSSQPRGSRPGRQE
jgi:hypothetical protein